MNKKNILIVVGILVLVILGFLFLSNVTGNVITGNVVGGGVAVENEYFRISDFGYYNKIEEEVLNGTQNNG